MKTEEIGLNYLLNEHTDRPYLMSRLQDFSCHKMPACEEFIRHEARNQEGVRCRTYLTVDSEKLRTGMLDIVAFYTLSMKTLGLQLASGEVQRPAFHIRYLARNGERGRSGYEGALLLTAAEKRIYRVSDEVGGSLLVADCPGDSPIKLIRFFNLFGYDYLHDERYRKARKPGYKTLVKAI